MAKHYDRDIEKGFVAKSEYVLKFVRRAMAQKRVLFVLFGAWSLYCAVVFGRLAWMKTIRLSGLSPPYIKRNRRLPLNQEASRRYLQVLGKVDDWEVRGLSRPWPIDLRNPYEFDLKELQQMMVHLMDENAFGCLAAVHVGIPTRVFQIGETQLVNPVLVEHGQRQVVVQEVSAFHPGESAQKKRYASATVTSMDVEYNFHDLQAVCVQHLLELAH